ncbi:MAG TPA: ArsA-related P-loop ATPase [Kofleriaceae bacterium]|nr:ArsA-related P-loop ATPase [Kofleriaceae bacterium]
MMPRLTILLGAGGVGKTTLSTALGLALARAGGKAALLSIDPARRLRSALGLADVPEHGIRVPTLGSAGSLDAALLDPGASLRRWVADDCRDDAMRARLLVNPYFLALADRLAGLTDAIGCARAVEWAERDPALGELVLDTAPGLAAVELLARPDKLMAFFDGRLIRWIVRLARFGGAGLAGMGHRMLSGISELSGTHLLREFGGLLSAVDEAVATMIARLERARTWLKAPSTSLVIVCGVSDDSREVARGLDECLRALSFGPTLVVLNRVLPEALATLAPPGATAPAEARAFLRYVQSYLAAQARVRAQLEGEFARVIDIPDGLPDAAAQATATRLDALAALGEPLRRALDEPVQAARLVALHGR